MIRPFLHPFPRVSRSPSKRRLSDFRVFGLPRSRSGSALVIVLGLLSVLMLMGVAFSVTMRTERGGASNMRHAAMARHTLDSAIARTMSDLDAELRSYEENGRFYGNAIPEDMVVLASGEDDDTAPVNLLSHEVARHLPSDQLASALYTQAHWLPIYGGVRVSNVSNTDPTSEDSPVGRYAYVILNGCGYLDPNVVGRESREYGLSTKEIVPGESSSGKLLGMKENGSVSAFLSRRNADGHYVNMRDFLRKSVTNIVKNAGINAKNAPFPITTNCFSIGSMAVDDPTPPVEVDGAKISHGTDPKGAQTSPVAYRLPKCSLVDEKGKLLKPSTISQDKAREIADAFTGAFYSTRTVARGLDRIPNKFPGTGYDIPYESVVARILLDAMDDDVIPGGTRKHSLDHINSGSADANDEYLHAIEGGNFKWDRFPCTEPVPMLDNIVFIGGSHGKPGMKYDEEKSKKYRQEYQNADGTTSYGAITGAVWTISFSLFNSSLWYAGWNVPKKAAGDYSFHWILPELNFDGVHPNDKKTEHFAKALRKVVESGDALTTQETTGKFKLKAKGSADEPEDRRPDLSGDDFMEEVATFDVVMTWDPNGTDKPADSRAEDWLPELFGLTIHATGYVTVGNDDNNVVQMAPCWKKTSNGGQPTGDDVLDIPLIVKTERMLISDPSGATGGNDHLLGGAYCLDPMFAYNKSTWIPGLSLDEVVGGVNDPISIMREQLLTHETMDGIADMTGGGPNPLATAYLKAPNAKYGNKRLYDFLEEETTVVGGCSDVMWANPGIDFGNRSDKVEEASRAFYFDPDAMSDSPFCFNRVGQLGFLPIGTYRTIALLDGFSQNAGGALVRTPRQRVLDYFTMHAPRDEGSAGTDETHPGDPVKAALFTSRVNVNPPRSVRWKKTAVNGTTKLSLESDDYNLVPITAVLSGCPLREWASTDIKRMTLDWSLATELAEAYVENLERDDGDARTEDIISHWNSDGIAHDISILGRSGQPLTNPEKSDLEEDPSWDSILRQETQAVCDFDREGVIRNSAEMFTARQQLFTLLLKADSFTPKYGYEKDAAHGTSLASVQAIVHVWRDPEPLRDAAGYPVRDRAGNAIHPYVVLDVYQF